MARSSMPAGSWGDARSREGTPPTLATTISASLITQIGLSRGEEEIGAGSSDSLGELNSCSTLALGIQLASPPPTPHPKPRTEGPGREWPEKCRLGVKHEHTPRHTQTPTCMCIHAPASPWGQGWRPPAALIPRVESGWGHLMSSSTSCPNWL